MNPIAFSVLMRSLIFVKLYVFFSVKKLEILILENYFKLFIFLWHKNISTKHRRNIYETEPSYVPCSPIPLYLWVSVIFMSFCDAFSSSPLFTDWMDRFFTWLSPSLYSHNWVISYSRMRLATRQQGRATESESWATKKKRKKWGVSSHSIGIGSSDALQSIGV